MLQVISLFKALRSIANLVYVGTVSSERVGG